MLPDHARFCLVCGTQLAGGPPEVPQPAGQPAGPPYPPSPTQWLQPVPPPPPPRPQAASGSKTGLVVGIVAGVLILLLGIGVFSAYVAFKPPSSAEESGVGAQSSTTSELSTAGGSSTSVEMPSTTTPQPTNTEPPTTVAAVEPATTTVTNPPVSLTEASAIDLVGNYLNDAKQGDSSKARAVTTSRYQSRITSDYYKLAANELEQFEVVNAEKGQGGYLVFVREQWSSGTWTNWYLVVRKNSVLVIDDTGTE